jgi:hypothetical protein
MPKSEDSLTRQVEHGRIAVADFAGVCPAIANARALEPLFVATASSYRTLSHPDLKSASVPLGFAELTFVTFSLR